MTASRGRLIAAFAAVYLVWGSTYLFMRFAVETLPPVSVAGVRYFLAGAILYAFTRVRHGRPAVSLPSRGNAVVGILLTAGNGSVALAVQRIPSGVAALLVAMTPCFMVLLEWLWRGGARPRPGVVVGLLLGMAGTLVLVGPRSFGGSRIDPLGAAIVLGGSVAWSVGSIYARTLPRYESAARTSAVQMLWGGAVVTVIAALSGDLARFSVTTASAKSIFALAYLILIGSLIGYSAYMYLLGATTAARASTYAFVNPVVAMVLGTLFAGEPLTARVLVAGAIIVLAVALITVSGSERHGATSRR
jgi:drug/metabolite transporter (DMT)-like permease